MSAYRLPDIIEYYVTANNWIQNGNTRSTCYRIHEGGIRVFFTADKMLYGSYGGTEGKPAGIKTQLASGIAPLLTVWPGTTDALYSKLAKTICDKYMLICILAFSRHNF